MSGSRDYLLITLAELFAPSFRNRFFWRVPATIIAVISFFCGFYYIQLSIRLGISLITKGARIGLPSFFGGLD